MNHDDQLKTHQNQELGFYDILKILGLILLLIASLPFLLPYYATVKLVGHLKGNRR